MKVAIGGPPHSGKSTFTAALIEVIRHRITEEQHALSFGWLTLDVTDNTLGYLLDSSGTTHRRENRAEWNEASASARASTFASRTEQLVIADTPGLLTPELDIVIEPTDAMIILAQDAKHDQISKWERKAEENGLDVVARFLSVMDPDRRPFWDRTSGTGLVQSVQFEEFRMYRLEAYDDATRDIIRQLGAFLIAQVMG